MKNILRNLPLIQSNQLGIFYVALSAILYGFMAFFGTKLVDHSFTVINMLFWRFALAALWVVLCTAISRKNIFDFKGKKQSLMTMTLYNVGTYSIGSALYFYSSQYIGTGVSMVIFFSYPLFVALFSYLFSQWQVNKYALISLALVSIGLFFLKGDVEVSANLYGITLAVLAAFCYAIYIFCNHSSTSVIHPQLLTLIICTGNAFVFFVVASTTHHFQLPETISAWGYAFGLGIIGTALPIQLMLNGLKYISPVKASILTILEPVTTVIMGVMLLAEQVTALQLVGMAIILLGAVVIQLENVSVAEEIIAVE